MTDAEERRLQTVEDKVGQALVNIGSLSIETRTALAGVSNFRKFQVDMRQVLSELLSEYRGDKAARAQQENDAREAAERLESHKWSRTNKIAAVGVMAMFLVPASSWVIYHGFIFCGELYRITQEWETLHKTELDQQKKISQKAEPEYSSNRKLPKYVGIPPEDEAMFRRVTK
jgi:hypothetical protein